MSLTLAPVINTTTVTIEIPKETYELVEGLVAVATAAKAELADGFQPGRDLSAIAMQSWSALLTALQGAEQIGTELRASPAGGIAAGALLFSRLAALFAG